MAANANILLEVLGDASQAEDEVEDLTRDLLAFSRIDAEAEASIDAKPAQLALAGLAASADGAGGSVGGLDARLGPLGGNLGAIAGIGGALLPVLGALAAAAAALAASFAAALAAASALAIGFGATLLPAIALGVGALQRFKAQSGIAGTEAHKLLGAFEDFKGAFSRAIGPAADAVFGGIADALRSITPMIRSLRPAFAEFGRTVGRVFATLGEEFSNPAWTQFFRVLIRGASRLAGPLSRVFIQISRLLRDIAQAALPFVVRGFRALAGWLGSIRQRAGGLDGIREVIRRMMPHLQTWMNLFAQIGRSVLNFFIAAAPAGKALANWLAKGAKALADWLADPQGRAEVRRWFEQIMPLVKSIGRALWAAFKAALAFIAALAEPLTHVFNTLTDILGVLGDIIDAFKWLGEHGGFGAVGDGAGAAAKGGLGLFNLFADGVRNFSGGMAIVGERGPELVNLPRGSDVYSNAESRRLAGGGHTFQIMAPGGGVADPRLAAAHLDRRLRERGMTTR